MEYFNTVAGVIVLIGSVVAAIAKICEWLGKPILWIKTKKKEQTDLIKQLEHINERLATIASANAKQTEDIERITKSSMDMLRQNIIYLYNHHKITRALSESEREYLEDLYNDYTNMNGNSYIKKLYNRMQKWTIVPDEEE